jgi:carbonic anhydrase
VQNLMRSAFLLLAACAAPPADRPTDTALDRLAAGNKRFVAGQSAHLNGDAARRAEVAKGQKPFAVIVGCADSRVPPELVFDRGLGDLFVVRVAGDVCEAAAIGSIEYAVEHLGVRTIVVLGHERCGAVDATLQGGAPAGHMGGFITPIAANIGAAASGPGDKLDNAVRANVRAIAQQLATCAPILSEFTHKGELTIVAARYDLDTGAVEILGEQAHGH